MPRLPSRFVRTALIVAWLCVGGGLGASAASVRSIGPALTLTLDSGETVALAGLVFPDLALARQWLETEAARAPITIEPRAEDRYGAALVMSDWHEALLRAGIAVAGCGLSVLIAWQPLEAAARAQSAGIWSPEREIVHDSREVGGAAASYHLVEGTLHHRHDGRAVTYLDFSAQWRSGFSAVLHERARRALAASLALLHPGSRLRVRGYVTQATGTRMEIQCPEQLEVLP